MAYGSGEGAKELNILISLTRAVLRNKDNKRVASYIKVWLYEALDLSTEMNHITAGLLIIIKETGFDFKNQKTLLAKCEEKLKIVPREVAKKIAEYYETSMMI